VGIAIVTSWQTRLVRLLNSEKCLVCGLAGVSLLIHLLVISQINYFVHDEFYYVPDAVLIKTGGNGLVSVQPSLGKLFITAGLYIFGFNPWGWRFFSIIFSVASVIIFYLICRKLGNKRIALFASLLFTFENLTFYYLGLGILDPFSIAFMLLSFLLYLQNRYALSGVSLALSGLCKLSGLFGVLVILAHWLITRRKLGNQSILFFIVALVAAFFLLMPVTDFLASGEWLNPFQRTYYLAFKHVATKATDIPPEARQSLMSPWEWILKPLSIDVDYTNNMLLKILITPTIWALIIPSMGYMLYEWIKNRSSIALFSLLWFCSTCLIWIPIVLVTHTYTYLYYFLPTVGAVCMSIGFGLNKMWEIGKTKSTTFGQMLRVMTMAYLLLHIALFFIFSPLLALVAPHLLHPPP
jgi:dolichyl-phosphate-mannose-protein mannosyltransferase